MAVSDFLLLLLAFFAVEFTVAVVHVMSSMLVVACLLLLVSGDCD